MRDVEPVKNGRRVPEDLEDRPRVDRAGELVGQLDRRLDDVGVAELLRDDQQLEVEGELLDREQGDDVGENLPPKQLEPGLGIANAEVEEQPDEELVDEALQPAQ